MTQIDLFDYYDPYLPERMYKHETGNYPDYVYDVIASTGTSSEKLIETFGKSSQDYLV